MKSSRLKYIVVPLVTILVAIVGSYFSSSGMTWYNSDLITPSLNPPKWIFPVAWNLIFILTTISAIIFWGKLQLKEKEFRNIFVLFTINAFLNVFWSYLFFVLHDSLAAFVEMLFLNLSLVAIFVLGYRYSKIAAYLLLPYFLWVSFATYLTYLIMQLN